MTSLMCLTGNFVAESIVHSQEQIAAGLCSSDHWQLFRSSCSKPSQLLRDVKLLRHGADQQLLRKDVVNIQLFQQLLLQLRITSVVGKRTQDDSGVIVRSYKTLQRKLIVKTQVPTTRLNMRPVLSTLLQHYSRRHQRLFPIRWRWRMTLSFWRKRKMPLRRRRYRHTCHRRWRHHRRRHHKSMTATRRLHTWRHCHSSSSKFSH